MHDQVLIWNTDANLEITTFTARLRDFAGIGREQRRIRVGDLWPEDSPYSIPEIAHRWALDGESVIFEAPSHGSVYRFEIAPLLDVDGKIIGVTGSATDVNRISERGLRPGAYAQAENHAGIGFWHQDLRTGRTTMSGGLGALLGIDPNSGTLDIRAYDHPEDRSAIARVVNDPASAERYTCDHRVCFGNSRVRMVRERVQTVFDPRGVAVAKLGTLLDITDFKEREADLSELALTDPLTRLANRALLFERLASAVSRTRRYRTMCGVLFIDLDGFKTVNDTLGHDAGDDLLKQFANHLLGHFRPTDTVARLGGDEFVVIVEDLYSEEAAASAAEHVLRSLERTFELRGHQVRISASIGVATVPNGSENPAEILAIADAEMYRVKKNGGHSFCVAPSGSLQSA